MDPVETLLAVEEIKHLVARRCRSLDAQDWETYAACHTPDVVSYAISTESGAEEPTRGIDAVLAFLRRQLEGRTTVHQVHSPEITLTGAATASGTWAMEDRLWWERDGTAYWIHGFGHYRETYEKRDDRWLVASRRLERIRVERGSGTPPARLPGKMLATGATEVPRRASSVHIEAAPGRPRSQPGGSP